MKLIPVMVETIDRMRNMGATDEDIARVLSRAASELQGAGK